MIKKNIWIVDNRYFFDRLLWSEDSTKEFYSIEKMIKRIELIIKTIEKQKETEINYAYVNVYSKDNQDKIINPHKIEFKTIKQFKEEINKYNKNNLTIESCSIMIKTLVSMYGNSGEIKKDWIEDSIKIFLSNSEISGMGMIIKSLTDIWMPDTYVGEREPDSCNNVELARLNLPILDTLLKNLIKELKIKFEVHEELSKRNKSMLIIKDDEIRMK